MFIHGLPGSLGLRHEYKILGNREEYHCSSYLIIAQASTIKCVSYGWCDLICDLSPKCCYGRRSVAGTLVVDESMTPQSDCVLDCLHSGCCSIGNVDS
jgi:hypothetical protein